MDEEREHPAEDAEGVASVEEGGFGVAPDVEAGCERESIDEDEGDEAENPSGCGDGEKA